jgi:hypothetical protein
MADGGSGLLLCHLGYWVEIPLGMTFARFLFLMAAKVVARVSGVLWPLLATVTPPTVTELKKKVALAYICDEVD